ncbi:GNAT family N-acetyltransferase [Butyrivibrio sp. CB08]|uniref:GNAT family N-acetyltransferase n=1 Tax=Butyrivibrio sp. CB08 TaxID=2364879 RepID=UPI000EA927AC|nr:GNAT family N-acetyltransferase [Butyrivibrio sp. CB08]RKM61485.1 GNAT family N-acetyltransferase [Butyrivibrio sp. CB08]
MIIDEYSDTLKDGKTYGFKSVDVSEAQAMFDLRYQTALETDFLTRYPEEFPGTCDREAESIKNAAESEKDVFLGAYDGDKLIGAAHVSPKYRHKKFAHRCDIGILVSKDYWSCGVGKKLMLDAMDFSKKMGYTVMQLETFDKNERGIGLYEHLGFTRVGAIPFGALRKDGTYYEEVIMYKVL